MSLQSSKQNLEWNKIYKDTVLIKKHSHTLYKTYLVKTLVFAVFLIIAGNLAAWGTTTYVNDEVHTQLLSGQAALYRGEFDEALRVFTALTQTYPADPKGYFFVALTYRWLTRIDPESSRYQREFERAAEKTMRIAKLLLNKDETHVEATLYLAATYGYRAEYYNFLKNRWDKAYDDGVKMRKYLEKAEELSASDNVDVQLGYGLYNYYAYVYRKKIGRWRFLFSLPKGDKKKGIELLHSVREKGMYAKVEAWYFLIDIYKKDRDFRDKAVSLCEQLHQTYPSHPFFHIVLAGIYHKNNDWPNSLRTANEILGQAETNANPYYSDYIIYQAKYLMGESSFFIGKYQEALRQFDEIIASKPPKPPYLLPWSHLRRGNIYDRIGKKNEATVEYKLVLRMENVLKVHDWAKGALKNQQKRK